MNYPSFDERADAPPPIKRFEQLWLLSLVVSLIVAILTYPEIVDRLGSYSAAISEVLLFGTATGLMFLVSRRRSNLSRWLLTVGFAGFLILYLSYFGLIDKVPLGGPLAVLHLSLQVAALVQLYARDSRAWLAVRTLEEDD
ncbi:MAG: hypothetical protein JSR90_21285 [Proteobacteria bacterium]|nr:hypothetical protein [Pseudomonadota bacterium]